MKKLYPIGSLKFTVFDEEECLAFLRTHGIELTNDIHEASVLVQRDLDLNKLPEATQYITALSPSPKPVLVWTHEPRFCKTDQHLVTTDDGFHFHIMNLYTRNVHLSNFTFYGKNIDQHLQHVTKVSFASRPVAALATWVAEEKQPFQLQGIDIDLSIKRQRLITDAYHQQLADIYGRNWPADMATGESRGPGWHLNKLDILKNYQFNIALENTAFEHYCTEKIWDSIKSYCLPVYSTFNNSIATLFPSDSFIDFDQFSCNEHLIAFIRSMSHAEYLRRLNTCIDVYNDLYLRIDVRAEKEKALEKIIEKIAYLTA